MGENLEIWVVSSPLMEKESSDMAESISETKDCVSILQPYLGNETECLEIFFFVSMEAEERQALAPRPAGTPTVEHKLTSSSAREELDEELWGLVLELAMPDALCYLRTLPLVCKSFRTLVLHKAWPRRLVLLDLRWCRQPVPERVWLDWARRDVHFSSLLLSGRGGWRAQADTVEAVLSRVKAQQMRVASLDLQNSRVTDRGLSHLSGLPVTHLNLDFCYSVTDAGLAQLRGLPLRHLSLHCCRLLTDEGLLHLSSLPLLHLDLDSCARITSQGLSHLRALPLRHLSLYSCTRISAEVGVAFSSLSSLPLRFLDLRYCPVASSAALPALLERLPVGCDVRT
eukprot:g43420.t1